jgi:integrase
MQHSEAHHSQLRRWLKGRIGTAFSGQTLHEVTTKRITNYLQARTGQSFKANGWHSSKRTSVATVNRELAAIKVVFSQAVAWDRIEVSPAAGIPSLKETPNPPRLLSGAEAARLLAAMPDHLRAAVGMAVYAGLRRAEVMRIRWEHVDMKAEMLTVASRSDGRTKSNKDRHVPISPDLAELIRRHPHKLGARLLFPNDEGGIRHDFRTALVAAAKRAGIGKIGMHQLRHAFVSHALMNGADPRSVQQWCGHADLTTTMRYAHTSPDHEKVAIGRVRYVDDAAGREVG